MWIMKTGTCGAMMIILLITVSVFGQDSIPETQAKLLIAAAITQTGMNVTYDGSYRRIAYPDGDVPETIGVCTDIIVRAYRAIGIDLQVKIHEDMRGNFDKYPKIWGLRAPDPNIDHRRVPNLQTFFRRAGSELPVTRQVSDYLAGDLVTWMLPGNRPHIGIVIDAQSFEGVPLVVHNIGRGPEIEDVLFTFPITGHYRYGLQ